MVLIYLQWVGVELRRGKGEKPTRAGVVQPAAETPGASVSRGLASQNCPTTGWKHALPRGCQHHPWQGSQGVREAPEENVESGLVSLEIGWVREPSRLEEGERHGAGPWRQQLQEGLGWL